MPENPLQPSVLQLVEAPAFSRFREGYLDDEAFAELQRSIAADPEQGDLVSGAGGIRKLRWKDSRRGNGKRGGGGLFTTVSCPMKKYGSSRYMTRMRPLT
ncbi:hypothetical protein [Terracidiphilus sp.]|jgi:hypothetical protein|uniref:hypothetical protein n=1 Tax=Terracidiphilus sp. TaxID=1964191 RepID=UPI003C183566